MRKFETTVPISVKKQVEFDALHQPHEICKWDKRRKCDSYYIQMYKEEKKKIEKAIEYIEDNWITYQEAKFNGDIIQELNIEISDIRVLLEILGDSNE